MGSPGFLGDLQRSSEKILRKEKQVKIVEIQTGREVRARVSGLKGTGVSFPGRENVLKLIAVMVALNRLTATELYTSLEKPWDVHCAPVKLAQTGVRTATRQFL